MRFSKVLALAAVGLCALALLEGYFNGPDIWVMKYNFEGQPSSTASREFFMGFSVIFLLFINGLVFTLSKFINSDRSLTYVNMPNKSYWTQAGNVNEALRRASLLLDGVVVVVNVIYLAVILMTRFEIVGTSANVILAGILTLSFGLTIWSFWIFKKK